MEKENSENQHQHHHHHHHHKHIDDATRFKRRSLASIERRKKLAKWSFRALVVVAVLSVLALITVYMID